MGLSYDRSVEGGQGADSRPAGGRAAQVSRWLARFRATGSGPGQAAAASGARGVTGSGRSLWAAGSLLNVVGEAGRPAGATPRKHQRRH